MNAAARFGALLFCLSFVLLIGALPAAVAADSYPAEPFPELLKLLSKHPRLLVERVRSRLESFRTPSDSGKRRDLLLLLARGYEKLGLWEAMEEVLQQLRSLAAGWQDAYYQAWAESLRASSLDIHGDLAAALAAHDRAVSLAGRSGNQRLLADLLLARGETRMNNSLMQLAMADYLSAYAIYEQYSDQERYVTVYQKMAVLYAIIGDYPGAIQYYQKAMQALAPDDFHDIAATHINLSATYGPLGDWERAERHPPRAREIAVEHEDANSLAYVDYWLADLRSREGRHTEARDHFLAALEYFVNDQDLLMQFNSHIELVDVYRQLAQIQELQEHLQRARVLATELDQPELRLLVAKAETRMAADAGDYETAYRKLRQQLDVQREIEARSADDQLQQLQIQFDVKQKQAENRLLKEKNHAQELAIAASRAQRNLALAIGLLVLVILLFTLLGLLHQRRMRHRLAALALEDSLTGAANRRHILQLAQQEMDRACRYQEPFALAMVDLDHFKHINDSFGHAAGDQVLCHFVRCGRQSIRQQDSIGRLGGEEWLLLFPQTVAGEVEGIVKRIRDCYAGSRVDGIPRDHSLTFSTGITERRESDRSLQDMLGRADRAMYQGKRSGRDHIVVD